MTSEIKVSGQILALWESHFDQLTRTKGVKQRRRRDLGELCPSTLGSCDSPTTWKTARFFFLMRWGQGFFLWNSQVPVDHGSGYFGLFFIGKLFCHRLIVVQNFDFFIFMGGHFCYFHVLHNLVGLDSVWFTLGLVFFTLVLFSRSILIYRMMLSVGRVSC